VRITLARFFVNHVNDKPYSKHKKPKITIARNTIFSVKTSTNAQKTKNNIEYKSNSVTNNNNYKFNINEKNITKGRS
jgi:hypothetical protein